MPRYNDHVPYVSLVEWDEPQVRAYAEEIAATHKPPLPRRWVGDEYCRECGAVWPCVAATWAQGMVRLEPEDQSDTEAVFELIAIFAVIFVIAVIAGLVWWL